MTMLQSKISLNGTKLTLIKTASPRPKEIKRPLNYTPPIPPPRELPPINTEVEDFFDIDDVPIPPPIFTNDLIHKCRNLFTNRFNEQPNPFRTSSIDIIAYNNAMFSSYSSPDIPPQHKVVNLPENKNNKPTLILDLDNTMWFSCLNPSESHIDSRYIDSSFYIETHNRYLFLRPWAKEFIHWATSRFEIVLYSAGSSSWVHSCLKYLDPNGYINDDYVLCRESTVQYRGSLRLKYISFLGRDSNDCVFVDDLWFGVGHDIENVYPIKPFDATQGDDELLILTGLLDFILDTVNRKKITVKEVLKKITDVSNVCRDYVMSQGNTLGKAKNSFWRLMSNK